MTAAEDFEAFGAEIAELQDEVLEDRADDLPRVRTRLLRPRPPTRRRLPLRPIAAALAVAAAVALAWFATRPAEDLGFTYAGERGAEGGWIRTQDEADTLSFTDGSEAELAADTSVRVAELTPRGARLDLQRGAMHVHVVHQDDTSWQVHAGPFEVRVIGTTFDVAWDPDEERFDLRLDEGRVVVVGPTISQRAVTTGETVTVQLPERRVQIVQLDIPEPEPEPAAPSLPEVEDPEPELTPRPRRRRARQVRIDWRELAENGQDAQAVAAADWDRELARADARDLLLLGNAARRARSNPRARAAFTALRTRHAGTRESAQAAFLLGRLDLRAGRASQAAAWFERSVSEAPTGVYGEPAAGRLIEAYRRSGNEIAARRAARAYLEHHPRGPHAPAARQVLEDAEQCTE